MMKNGEDAGWRLKKNEEKIMLTETFDKDTEQMISRKLFTESGKRFCDICIVTFSDVVVEEIRKNFDCTTVAEIGSVNGDARSIFWNIKGKRLLST